MEALQLRAHLDLCSVGSSQGAWSCGGSKHRASPYRFGNGPILGQCKAGRGRALLIGLQAPRILRPSDFAPVCCSVQKSAIFPSQNDDHGVLGTITSETVFDEALTLKTKAQEIVKDLKGTCIFLIGMMGSGKSTVGRILSEALGYYFFDSDKLVEEAAGGATVAQIFEESKEDWFRDAESEVLNQLSAMCRLVVATGGGAVVRPKNWGYIRHGITVWLDVPLEALAHRVVEAGTETRPLLGKADRDGAYSQAYAQLSRLLEERGQAYSDADTIVSLQDLADDLGVDDPAMLTPTLIAIQVLEEIKLLLKQKNRVKQMSGF